jgi:hypothetical protein
VESGDLVAGALELTLAELLRQRLVLEVNPANPAAGAEIVQAVPAGEVWELLTIAYRLSTSAAVANRSSAIAVFNPNNLLVAQIDPPAVQAAGAAKDYSYQQEIGAAIAGAVNTSFLPAQGMSLGPGYQIKTVTAAIDVADQYSRAVIMVRQWSIAEALARAEYIERNLR